MITYKCVSRRHGICGKVPPAYLNKLAVAKWREWALGDAGVADGAVIANVGTKVIGFFRYNLGAYSDLLIAYGTWVDSKYRRRGVTSKLWKKAIAKVKPYHIDVTTTSHAGYKFASKLAKQYNDVAIYINDVSP